MTLDRTNGGSIPAAESQSHAAKESGRTGQGFSALARPMRIVFVAHSSGWGGAEKCLALLLESLPRDRFLPMVVARPRPVAWRGKGQFAAFCRRADVPYEEVDLRWWARDWQHDAAFADGVERRVERLAKLFTAWAADVIVTNTSVVVEGALAAARCGLPHVWHVLEMIGADPGLNPFLSPEEYYRFIMEWSARVIVVSRAVAEHIGRFVAEARLDILPTGLPPPSMPRDATKQSVFGLADNVPVVLYVGLLSRRKGVLDLVESAARVLRRRPETRFFLAGRDGGVERLVRQRIAEAGLENRISLLGFRDDVPRLLAACDLVVLPSLADPLPVAILEAMSLGRPVIATRSGGCEEMVLDGRTGRLVMPGDPQSLAEAIVELLEDPQRAAMMGEEGRVRFAACYSQHTHAQRFGQLLVEVAHGQSASTDRGHRSRSTTTGAEGSASVEATIARLAVAARRRRSERWKSASWSERLRERALTLAYRCGAIH